MDPALLQLNVYAKVLKLTKYINNGTGPAGLVGQITAAYMIGLIGVEHAAVRPAILHTLDILTTCFTNLDANPQILATLQLATANIVAANAAANVAPNIVAPNIVAPNAAAPNN